MTFSKVLFAIASSLIVSNAFAFSAEQSGQNNEAPKTVAEAEKSIKWLDDELQPTDDRSEAEYLLDKVEKTDDGFRLYINYIDGGPYYETGADSLNFAEAIAIGPYKTYFESGVLRSEGQRDTNGEQQGETTVYSKNGHKKREMTYKDGELNGPYRTYASTGYLLTEKTMKDGERNGLMRHYYENGQVKYEAEYKDDVEQGIGKRWDFEGNLVKESFYEDGVLNGLSTDYYEDGSVKRTQEYKNRKRVGETKLYYENGELRQYEKRNDDGKLLTSRSYDESGQLTRSMEHVETAEHGLVEEKKWYNDSEQLTRLNRQAVDNSWRLNESYDEDGNVRDRREFKGYDLHGLYISRYGNGLEKVRFVEGKRHGPYTITDKDGKVTTSGEYDHGKKVGEWVSKDSYGEINEHYDQEGKLDGVREVYGENGDLRLREHYKDDLLDGAYQEYADGEIVVEGKYVEGKREGEWQVALGYAPYEISRGSYENGVKVGEWRTYSPQGYLRGVESFDSEGYLDGIVVNFTDEGALFNISEYKRDRRHGKSWSYTQSGQPFSISVYEDGRLKEERFEDEFELSEFP
ncbi:hypothetical protein [Idiomarina sp.]|uniref:hypothetical protein n=1 Tax=Idiomarina sp. TaxID=1874361 RepID=UPI003A93D833